LFLAGKTFFQISH